MDRRNFIKTLGIAGATLAVGKSLAAAPSKIEGEVEFYGVLYDSTICIGCRTCERACAKENGDPKTKAEKMVAGTIRTTDETRRTVVNTYNTTTAKGKTLIKKQCMHCNEPACAAACLTQAMYKTKEGPVIWRGDKCMGCRYCMVSCPFDVPKFEYHSANPKIVKCTMCPDRVKQGKAPACADRCPVKALVFGTRRELIAEARRRIAESPEEYVHTIYGEHEAGGTSFLYLSAVPFKEVGFNPSLQKESYPSLSKGFLYSVPSVFVLWPAILLGLHEATKNNHSKEEENE